MATALVRSGFLRTALRGGARGATTPKRNFASSGHHDDAYETAKWEKITYLGIATCTILAIYTLSKGHPHFDETPSYPYLHIRNKEFPWGPDGLFESKHH
ncbi:cytochrome c oxidase subunit 6a, mitochondrial [Gastrolobium bilobum]|uniref:cytochrome c oxidase subunit 6a, mitochondrial n=1 Tax=Gastrolobium bilobum TaxID=150636 RepID=UPI002AB24163|nr:cytochrome c oxidase subunit 6a, mitochondrial [Gastrolobium bilobum]